MKKTFKVLFLVLALAAALALFSVAASAEEKASEGLKFTSNGDGTCYVKKGTCTDTDIIIPSVSPDGDTVTSIGDYAFSYCDNLTSVTIPDSVTSIGYEAFYYYKSLTSITIPDSVTSIDGYAFYYCTSLTSITIPDSVTSIGYSAFYNCSSLKDVYITDVEAWLNISFGNYNSYPNYYGTLHILDAAGYERPTLIIPDSVTSIGGYAFRNCKSITSITIPDSVTSIG